MKFITKLSILTAFVLVVMSTGNFSQASQIFDDSSSIAPNSAAGSATSSYNWAGYTATGGSYTSVSGTWTVPTVSASSSFLGDATWVGIGGVNSSDLIQTGTQAIVQGSNVTYQAWYEMLPSYSQNAALTVHAGDSITASISQLSSGQWNISLIDNTTGQTFQTAANYNSSLSSAEWVEEMPSQSSNAFIPLDNFGQVQFSSGSVVSNGQTLNLSQASAQPLTMLNLSGQALANASSIYSDGASFSVTRTSAVATSSSAYPFGGRGRGRVGRGPQGFSPMPARVIYLNGGGSGRNFQFPLGMFRYRLRQQILTRLSYLR